MTTHITGRFLWLCDVIFLCLAFELAYLMIPLLQPLFGETGPFPRSWLADLAIWNGPLAPFPDLFWIFLATVPATLVGLGLLGNHRPLMIQTYTRIVAGSLLAPILGLSVVALTLFALKDYGFSRLFVFAFSLLGSLELTGYRLLLRIYLLRRRAAGFYAKNVVLVGLPEAIEWLANYFTENFSAADYRLLGYLRLDPEQPAPFLSGPALPCLGNSENLGDLLINRPIHEVIAIHPVAGGKWIADVIEDCDHLSVLLRIVPEALLLGERRTLRMLYPFEPLHLPAVVLTPAHWDSDALFVKRVIDVIGAAILLGLLSPVLLAIAVAIKLTTPNLPILYPWRVVGQNGVEFTGWKFTTMVSNADQVKDNLLAFNEMSGPVFKMKDDPRVTPLGRFLRKFSLNELPQLWSVLTGHMSLVGPRPAFRHELERYEFWHKRKLSIKPGITCLWQVRGRNKISNFDDWVKMDLEYIDNWSLWLDLKILIRTAWAVVGGTGS